jgi:hypothetical protein
MGEQLDAFAKALASGFQRRQAIGRLTAGVAAALVPWRASEAANQFQEYCRTYCRNVFDGQKAKRCIDQAKQRKGPCYKGAPHFGPAFLCRTSPCSSDEKCCPSLDGTDFRECCAGNTCHVLNGTSFCVH